MLPRILAKLMPAKPQPEPEPEMEPPPRHFEWRVVGNVKAFSIESWCHTTDNLPQARRRLGSQR